MINIKRDFIPGSDWFFLKIYTSTSSSDKILYQLLKCIGQQVVEKGLASKWFFIRYADPKEHLRFRILLSDKQFLNQVFSLINNEISAWIENKTVINVLVDTYQREIERYGACTMELSESLFFLESNFIVDALAIINRYKNEDLRWQFSLVYLDKLLSLF